MCTYAHSSVYLYWGRAECGLEMKEGIEKVGWKGIKSHTSYNAVLQRKSSGFEFFCV